jgi:hypothetical protein
MEITSAISQTISARKCLHSDLSQKQMHHEFLMQFQVGAHLLIHTCFSVKFQKQVALGSMALSSWLPTCFSHQQWTKFQKQVALGSIAPSFRLPTCFSHQQWTSLCLHKLATKSSCPKQGPTEILDLMRGCTEVTQHPRTSILDLP